MIEETMTMALSRARALGLIATVPAFVAHPASAQTSTPIRIGAGLSSTLLEPFLASDWGFFKRAGIDVEVVPLAANTGVMVQAVLGGSLDAALADPIQMAESRARNLPLAFFAGGAMSSSSAPLDSLCVINSSPIKTARDLEGQTVAVLVVNSTLDIAVKDWLRLQGADATKVKFFEMPFPTMLSALQRGTVASAFIGEPFLSAARSEVRVLGNCYDAIAPLFFITSWFSTQDWLAKNPQLARKFVQAIYETARWANAHRPERTSTYAKYAKLDPKIFAGMNWPQYGTSLEPRFMQPLIDSAVRHGLLEKPVAAADLIAKP
jgi:NitT/TauT family transport system substrate-binding protein